MKTPSYSVNYFINGISYSNEQTSFLIQLIAFIKGIFLFLNSKLKLNNQWSTHIKNW